MNKSLTLCKENALAAISIFAGLEFKNRDRKDAVLHIIEQTVPEDKADVAMVAIETCLDLFERGVESLASKIGHPMVSLALHISDLPVFITGRTAERLVRCAAKSGFHGRFPNLPRRLLTRDMNENDVAALISAYVSNIAVRSSSEEDKYMLWARHYLSPDKASLQIKRIEEFIEKWDSDI